MTMPSRPHHCCLQLSCASILHPLLLWTHIGILKAQSLNAWTKCAFRCCGRYTPEKSRSGARSAGVLQPTDVCVLCLCIHLLSAHSITQPGSEPYGYILTPSLQCLSSSAAYLSRIIFCCKTVEKGYLNQNQWQLIMNTAWNNNVIQTGFGSVSNKCIIVLH